MADNSIVTRIQDLVSPIVSDLGLELYDLEFAGGSLRITVDTPPGSPGGVDVDQLARCTRLVSRELDHEDPIPGHYTLEVSSPGLERNLRTPRHFQREIGKSVAVRLRDVVAGERRMSGVLLSADEVEFLLQLDDGHERRIAYEQVDRARTIFVWPAQDRPGSSKQGSRAKKASTSKSAPSPADSRAENDAATHKYDENDINEDQEHAES